MLADLLRFVSDPSVSGILLAVGLAGLLIEMQTLHGIAGAVGVAALALFFGTHIYAGFVQRPRRSASRCVGIAGMLFELHVVPGHGVPGILGVLALFTAIVFAFGFPFFFVAAQTIAIAIVLTVLIFFFAARAVSARTRSCSA